MHEIHIFLMPLNPPKDLIEKAMNLTAEYNEKKIGDL